MKKTRFRHYELYNKHWLEISDDIGAVNQAYAEILLKRYADNPRAFYVTKSNEKEMREWIVGQRLFQSLLNQYKIPYIHDEPVFKFECERLDFADFIVPWFGSIEIKTRPWNTDTMIIKKAPWDSYVRKGRLPDYVVALRLEPGETRAEIKGYEHGSEIDKLENNPNICIYSPGYCKLYSELHDFDDLLSKLLQCSIDDRGERINSGQQTIS